MIRKVIYCSLGVFMACQSIDTPQKPETLISEDKMVSILTDIAFVKAAKGSYKKVFDIKKINSEKYILEKYGIDSLVFAQNNQWYTGQLETYEAIFTKVKKNLEIAKDTYEKMVKEEDSIQKIKDSINRAKKIKTHQKPSDIMKELEEIDSEELE